jgi:cytoskeletal protein CcmA (bactofilin family)
MAIFTKSDQQTDYASNITTIAAGSHLSGRIEIECELHIDGEVDAEIHSTGTVKIGHSGRVNSDLKAKNLIIAGKFTGDAVCDSIEVISGGEAEGKLTATSLTIDSGSSFQGESIRKKEGDSGKVVNIASDGSVDPFAKDG